MFEREREKINNVRSIYPSNRPTDMTNFLIDSPKIFDSQISIKIYCTKRSQNLASKLATETVA